MIHDLHNITSLNINLFVICDYFGGQSALACCVERILDQ